MKEDDDGWMFPEIFKFAVSSDEDITFVERVGGVVGGTGMMIFEALGRTYEWLKKK